MLTFTPSLITIDLDGTMIDSAPDLEASVNAMQDAIGGIHRSSDQVRNWVGNGIDRLVHRALTGTFDEDADHDHFQLGLAAFRKAYSEHNGRHSALYPTVLDTLSYLKNNNFNLVCVTNKAAEFTQPLLNSHGIEDYFDGVIAGDSLNHRKPHPAQLQHAAAILNKNSDHCLHVGDSISDIKAARAASFSIVCVDYGYNHGQSIEQLQGEYGADLIISSFSDLTQCWP